MNQDQRAAFEAWAEGKAELHKMPSGEYSSLITRFASEAYQAALESQEVERLIDSAYERGYENGLREGDDFIAGCLT